MYTDKRIVKIRQLLWVYFILIIFEGALRKWVMPGFSRQLLVIRDPIALWIYALALNSGVFPRNGFISFTIILGFTSFIGSLMGTEASLPVILYGIRSNFLYLPLIFLIPKVFNRDDVIKIGKCTLWLSLLMALIMVIQFKMSRNSIWNVGVSGEFAQLGSALGKGRPPGLFSFSTGPVSFFPLVASFIIYGLFHKKTYNFFLIIAALISTMVALSVSGSRTLILITLLTMLTPVFMFFAKPEFFGKMLKYFMIGVVILFLFSSSGIFEQGTSVLTRRFEQAGGSKGITSRLPGLVLSVFRYYDAYTMFGSGLGLGTNVGSSLATGAIQVTWIEDEWTRHLMEGGFVFGPLYILLRIGIFLYLLKRAFRSLSSENILPLMIFVSISHTVLVGAIGQSTLLGFMVFCSGLCLAAVVIPEEEVKST